MVEFDPACSAHAFTPLTETRLREILDRITETRVCVLGDYCLDIYWFIDPSRSEKPLETGLPTNPVREQRCSLGGAGNVVNNLVAAGCRNVRALGVVGDDPWGHEMVRLLRQIGVNTEDMLVQKGGWDTLAYNKPHLVDEESSRFDFGNFNELASATAQELLARCGTQAAEADVIIINQQVRQGIHTDEFRTGLIGLIRRLPNKTFIVDSRHFSECYPGSIMKINDHEAARLCGTMRAPEELVLREEALSAAQALYVRFCKPVFVTRGSRGLILADGSGLCEIPAIQVLGQVDIIIPDYSQLDALLRLLGAGATA